MDRDDTGAASEPGRKSHVQDICLFAVLGLLFGAVVGSVLSTSPTARIAVKYVAPGGAILGLVAGIYYGFFFNIANRCKGGWPLFGIIGGIEVAAVGTLVIAFAVSIIGTLAGLAAGWLVGSLMTNRHRALMLFVGLIAGAVIQACWSNPTTGIRGVVWGCVMGAVGGPAFLLFCSALGYVAIRRNFAGGKSSQPRVLIRLN